MKYEGVKTKTVDLFGRAYMYFKLGWANYLALVLGLVAYFTIIYNFLLYKYVPANPYTYAFIGLILVAASVVIGIVSKRSGFWGREHQVSTEANPVLNYPIGDKEILSYDTAIVLLENQMAVNEALRIPTRELTDILDRTRKMRARANGRFSARDAEEETRLKDWSRDSLLQTQLLYDKIKPNSIFLDLGASIGDTAIAFAKNPNVKIVYAFEPIPYTYEEGYRNIYSRQPKSVYGKIKYAKMAIGGEDKILNLRYGTNENSGNTVSEHLSKAAGYVEVPQKTLDSLLKTFPPKSNIVLKIDIEGSEYEAIRAKIDLSNVYLIQLEPHPPEEGKKTSGKHRILKIISSQGFKLVTSMPEFVFIKEANYHAR